MRKLDFKFRNLGIVESADIQLKGLTVFTGLNDTGKSFISKTIYSIIKTLNGADRFFNVEKYQNASNNVNAIYATYRQWVSFTPEKQQEFDINLIRQKLANGLINKQPFQDAVKSVREFSSKILEDFESFRKEVVIGGNTNAFEEAISNIKNYTESIIKMLESVPDDETKFRYFFDRSVIERVFQTQLNSQLSQNDLEVNINEGKTSLLEISVEKNSTKKFKLYDSLYLNDATIIETPIILQFIEFITNSFAFNEFNNRGDLSPQFIDLTQKIRLSVPINSNTNYLEIYNKITDMVSGELKAIPGQGLVFVKKDGSMIRLNNVATGVKSFLIFQQLLNSGYINQNTLLIIDEPEVHLHPKWEVEYADIIVTLSKMNIPIIISTHSPNFLHALLFSINEANTQDITKIYFAERQKNNTTTFKDVSENLDPVFEALSDPIQKLFLNK